MDSAYSNPSTWTAESVCSTLELRGRIKLTSEVHILPKLRSFTSYAGSLDALCKYDTYVPTYLGVIKSRKL